MRVRRRILHREAPGDQGGRNHFARCRWTAKCFGTPVAYKGKITCRPHATCIASASRVNNPDRPPEPPPAKWPDARHAKSLQIIPSEVTLRSGHTAAFAPVRLMQPVLRRGHQGCEILLKWASFIPPTARVKSTLNGFV